MTLRAPAALALLGALSMACRAEPASAPAATDDPSAPVAAAPASPAAETSKPAPTPAAESTLAKATPTPEPAAEAEPEAPPAPAVPAGPRKVLILGDSLAATGFGALLERKLDAHPEIECFRKGKSASGLARPDFFDWPAEAKKQIEARSPDLVVVIMGGNDGQDMTPPKKKGKRVPWADEDAWKTDYRARVDAFLDDIDDDTRKVVWLGLPTMGLRSLETKLEVIRAIQKDAVVARGETYVDTAPMVTDASGELLANAKVGSSRKPQAIRAEDRIHFTMAGSEYFADRVYPEVLGVLGIADAPAAPASDTKPAG